MAVRFILGSAGVGKTHTVLTEIRRELACSPTAGPTLIVLVPEQAGLQMERALLHPTRLPGAHRCRVLSFRRLARLVQVHNANLRPQPPPLSAAGRVFVTRHLIARHGDRLRVFGRAWRDPRLLERLADHLARLSAADADPQSLSPEWAEASDQVADLLELHRLFQGAVPADRQDPAASLRAVSGAIRDGFFPRNSKAWMDGFAHLSRQELAVVVELARGVEQLSITLLVDADSPALAGSEPVEPFDLFAPTLRTYQSLVRALGEAGVPISPPLRLRPAPGPRFAGSAALARLQRHLFRLPPLAESSPVRGAGRAAVRCVKAPDRRSEVHAAVAEIQRLVQESHPPLRYRDMAIIVRDLEPYHDLLAASLTAHGIGHFIDRPAGAGYHPLLAFVRGLLAVLVERFSPAAVVGLLKTGLSGLQPDTVDALENYVLAFGLGGHQWFLERTWEMRRPTDFGAQQFPDQAQLERLEAARAALAETLRPWHGLTRQPDSPTAREWACGLLDRLEVFRVADRLAEWTGRDEQAGRHAQAALHRQLWEQLVDRLEELASVLGDQRLTAGEFAGLVDVALSSMQVAIAPPCIDQVLVGQIERSRHPSLRAVLLLGMTADAFPARPQPDGVLTDQDLQYLAQRQIDLGPPSIQRVLDERLLAYIALTRASETVYISWPARDERGQPLRPSPYLAAVRAAVPELREEIYPDDGDLPGRITCPGKLIEHLVQHRHADVQTPSKAGLRAWACRQPQLQAALSSILQQKGEALPKSVNAELINHLWPAPLEASVSRLECFAQCPFRHLASYGLELRRRLQAGLQPMDRGTLYHQILAKVMSRVVAGGGRLDAVDEPTLARWVADAVEQQLTELRTAPHLAEPRSQYLLQRCQGDMQAAVLACRAMAARGNFRILAVEQPFGSARQDSWPLWTLDNHAGLCVRLRGRIDRVDVADGDRRQAVVIDYKTHRGREQGLALAELLAGCELQLPAYLAATCAHLRAEPGGAFYLPLIPHYEQDRGSGTSEAQATPFLLRGIYADSAAEALDREMHPGQTSTVIKATKSKANVLDRRRSPDALPDEQLRKVLDYVGETLLRLTGQMLGGLIEPRPVERRGRLVCEFCDFQTVCRFDPRRHPARAIPRWSPAQAIERMGSEHGEHEVDA